MIRYGFLALVALGLAGCASAAAQGAAAERDCFRTRSVTGYEIVDSRTIRVRIGTERRYDLTTFENTSGLDFGFGATISSRTGFVCEGDSANVEITGGRPQRTYGVRNVTRAPDEPLVSQS